MFTTLGPLELLIILLIVIASGPLEAGTIHVDSRQGDDRGNGTAADPKASIAAALAVAVSGDRIRVAYPAENAVLSADHL